MANLYCDAIGIPVPSLEAVICHQEANSYSLMVVALLERGGPMTLGEVAARFEAAGISSAETALHALKRSRPARPPIYRDGDLYALDPHDGGTAMWVRHLGLRPDVPRLAVVHSESEVAIGPETPLSMSELEEAFTGMYLASWTAQRLALMTLDARGGRLPAATVISELDRIAANHSVRRESCARWGRDAAIRVHEDGTWEAVAGHQDLLSARAAARRRLEARRRSHPPSDSVSRAYRKRAVREHEARLRELGQLSRVLIRAFPENAPAIIVLVDVAQRELTTYVGPDLDEMRSRLAEYDVIGAVDIRRALRVLGFDPGGRRLVDLSPPQKTLRFSRSGRAVGITTAMMVQGSCEIRRPFSNPSELKALLVSGRLAQLGRRLESEAMALHALYEYGRLHGYVRVRRGTQHALVRVSWKYSAETDLFFVFKEAFEHGQDVEVVLGRAPDWADPWTRVQRCEVARAEPGGWYVLLDEHGAVVHEHEIQMLRVVGRTPS